MVFNDIELEKTGTDLIAVIVPVYNAEQYIVECVRSICNQTYRNLEIILVDDGSTDGSYNICHQLAKKDTRIKIFHKENGGPLSAKKMGIEKTEANFIMFVDADDWIKPEMCEVLYSRLIVENVDVVTSGIIKCFSEDKCIYSVDNIAEGRYSGEKYEKDVIPYMLCDSVIKRRGIDASLAIKIFRREKLYPIIKEADKSYGLLFAEDTSVIYPYMLKASSVYIMKECFYYHRQYPGHNEGYYEDENFDYEVAKLYTYMSNIFKESEYSVVLMKQLRYFIYGLFVTRAEIQTKKIIKSLPVIQQYLFPFSKVKFGSRVLLYGAGAVGQSFYAQLVKTGYCKKIIWQDKQYAKYVEDGMPVEDVNVNIDVDVCVIAIQNEQLAYEIRQQLLEKGLNRENIVWENPLLHAW